MVGPSYIHRYAESLGHGRAIMRVDLVINGVLIESNVEGSPAPIETIQRYERKVAL